MGYPPRASSQVSRTYSSLTHNGLAPLCSVYGGGGGRYEWCFIPVKGNQDSSFCLKATYCLFPAFLVALLDKSNNPTGWW